MILEEKHTIEEIKNYIKNNIREKTWQNIADYLNERFNMDFSESWYRKHWNMEWKFECEDENKHTDNQLDEYTKIQLQKKKLSDYVIQNNAYLRQISREQTIREIAHEYAEKMNKEKMLPVIINNSSANRFGKCAILEISDWHYGIEIETPFNEYNTDTCQYRVALLRDKVEEIIKKEGITTLYVVNLSDLISGRIHLPLRLKSRVDTITQVMDVSEILAEFLSSLSKNCDVVYYDCYDNHSRLEPNKNDSIDLESLTRIIKWYLKERLSNSPNVFIEDNKYGDEIITFKCCGHSVVGVHGHNDSVQSVISNMTMMTKEIYDLALIAHKHHFSVDEINEAIVVENGSLMGTDEYAQKLRKSAKPSQTLIVVSEDNPIEVIYRIMLDY